ncbi:MAG: SAM-dependent methyltransferase, partial [Nanoarchaeota archaeon]|nr:SAM-dependent methyltransferase [Nanoarchaeota archaeon]
NSFDCVLASDLIEHLTKEEGNKLIKMMEKIAKKRVIIFTPNGFLPQGEFNKNPWQVHKTGWTVEEMQKKGYKIIGINGIKSLRKEFTTIKYKPRFFWTIISDLTQIWTRNHPKYAFQILCIKDITVLS